MIATINLRIDAPSVQKVTALREQCAALLDAEQDIILISQSSAREDQTFTVVGVNLKDGERFEQQVDAETQADAEQKVATKQKVVTHVEGVLAPTLPRADSNGDQVPASSQG